jgi:hypothetical protein
MRPAALPWHRLPPGGQGEASTEDEVQDEGISNRCVIIVSGQDAVGRAVPAGHRRGR